jgi:hypothetical protein
MYSVQHILVGYGGLVQFGSANTRLGRPLIAIHNSTICLHCTSSPLSNACAVCKQVSRCAVISSSTPTPSPSVPDPVAGSWQTGHRMTVEEEVDDDEVVVLLDLV